LQENTDCVILSDGIAVRLHFFLVNISSPIPLHKNLFARDDLVGPGIVTTPGSKCLLAFGLNADPNHQIFLVDGEFFYFYLPVPYS
jgi:hypothetical protein